MSYGRLDIVGADPYSVIAGRSGGDEISRLLTIAGNAGLSPEETAAVIQGRMTEGAAVVRESMPSRARRYPMGIDSVDPVDPGDTVSVTSQPQLPFRVERLVVPSDIAGSFSLADFIVGKNSQFANEAAVPARVFDEQAEGVLLRGDTAQTSQNIVLKVTNISGAAIRFRACVIGTALDI